MNSFKRGNPLTFSTLVKDSSGTTITNLATATDVIFMLKTALTIDDSEAIVTKKQSLGEITVNDPTVGTIKIPLDSDDMSIPNKKYYMAIQIIYSATEKVEIQLKSGDTDFNRIEITNNIIKE